MGHVSFSCLFAGIIQIITIIIIIDRGILRLENMKIEIGITNLIVMMIGQGMVIGILGMIGKIAVVH